MAGTLAEATRTRPRHTSKAAFAALLGFFVVEYVRPGIYVPILEAVHVNSIIPLTAFALALFAPAGRANAAIFRQPITRWMLFFVALFFVQFLTVDVRLYVFEKLGAVAGYVLIYYAILRNVTSIARFKAVFATLIGVHVVMLVLHPGVVLEPEKRHYVGGTFLGDGNDFAWSACIVVPLAHFLFRHDRRPAWRYAYLLALLLLIIAVIGTQSRGGSIALALVSLYLVAWSKRRAAGLALLAVVAGVVLFVAPPAYFERMESVSTYQADGSAQGRLSAWNSALRMALDHPFTGVGAGHFSVKFGLEYRPPGVGRREMPWLNAHSIYFVALGEFGFSGIVFLLAVIGSGFLGCGSVRKRLHRRNGPRESELRELALAVQCSLIGFAVAGTFLSGLYYPHLFVVSALCVAVMLLERDDRGAQPEASAAPGTREQPASLTAAIPDARMRHLRSGSARRW